MRRGPRASALAAAAAVLALVAACGTPEAGSAAVVGDRRISQIELQQATADVQSIVPPENPITRQTVLGWLITEPYLSAAARSNGLGVSEDDVRQIFTSSGFRSTDGSGAPSEAALRAVRSALALQKIAGQGSPLGREKATEVLGKVSADLQAAQVRVNPRFGTFDPTFAPENGQVFSVTAGPEANWLVPSPSPSPAASPGAEPGPGAEPTPQESPTP